MTKNWRFYLQHEKMCMKLMFCNIFFFLISYIESFLFSLMRKEKIRGKRKRKKHGVTGVAGGRKNKTGKRARTKKNITMNERNKLYLRFQLPQPCANFRPAPARRQDEIVELLTATQPDRHVRHTHRPQREIVQVTSAPRTVNKSQCELRVRADIIGHARINM